MKRIARLLAVSLVLLGVMLASLPARALANSYPTADEVYVSGKPISQSTDQYTTYEPSSGTLTITRQVNGISVVSDRDDLDLNIVVDGNVYVYRAASMSGYGRASSVSRTRRAATSPSP